MSGLIYQKEHRVKYYECDATKQISIPMLLNIMLYVSGEQSYKLGVGDAILLEKGLSWIILQNDIHIQRLPEAGETITITTQALSYNKLFTYREFKAFDETGELCVQVHCTFALMDFAARKMARIAEDVVAPYQVEASKKLIRTQKPEKVDLEKAATIDYRVRYLDIDANQHVNNSKYLDWFLDSLGLDFIKTHRIKSLNVKYEKEVAYGNMVQSKVSLSTQEDGSIISAHQIVNHDVLSCEASMVWEPLNE